METILLGNLLTIMIVFSLPAILPVVIKPYGENRFGPSAPSLSFGQAIKTVLHKTLDFKGRASRSEFGWAALVFAAIYLAAYLIAQWTGLTQLPLIALLAGVPLIAAGVRRLHDINRTGFWLIIGPLGLGAVALVVLLLWPSQKPSA